MNSFAKERQRVDKPRLGIGVVLLDIICGLILLFLILPILIVIPISFSSSQYLQFPPSGFSLQWYEKFFTGANWISAMLMSLRVGLVTTIISTSLGTMAAYTFVRGRFRGKELLYPIILSPTIVPIIILALVYYFFFSRLRLIGSPLALILAHTVLAIPFVVINVSATLKGFDFTLEKAAMNLGANPVQTFFRVTLPLIKPGIIAGALFAFITSFDEIVVAMFICGTTAMTLPKRMLDGIRDEIDPTISAVSSIEIIVVIIILLTVWFVTRQRSESS